MAAGGCGSMTANWEIRDFIWIIVSIGEFLVSFGKLPTCEEVDFVSPL